MIPKSMGDVLRHQIAKDAMVAARKEAQQKLATGKITGEMRQAAKAIAHVVRLKGWEHIEEFVLRAIDPVGLINTVSEKRAERGEYARGLLDLLSCVYQMVAINEESEKPAERKETLDKPVQPT